MHAREGAREVAFRSDADAGVVPGRNASAIGSMPFTVGYFEQGGRHILAAIPIVIRAVEGFGYTNDVGSVDLAVKSASEPDGVPGHHRTISFLLTARGFAVPRPSTALAVLAAILVAFSFDRISRR